MMIVHNLIEFNVSIIVAKLSSFQFGMVNWIVFRVFELLFIVSVTIGVGVDVLLPVMKCILMLFWIFLILIDIL